MIRVFEKPVRENWANISLDSVVYIIEKAYTTFNPELLRVEVDESNEHKFERGKLLKTEYFERGVFKYTVGIFGKAEPTIFYINEYYFKAEA